MIKNDVILRSRIRLARNIIDYPFAPVLDDACRREIIEKAENVLLPEGFSKISCENNLIFLSKLSEKNLISREFAKDKDRRALLSKDSVYIMVCEEDHLRIQAFEDGLNLNSAFKKAISVEQKLSSNIKFAFKKDLGYLTHCPTNLGTAMRASVMMFLPALTISNRMGELKTILEKAGITIRGIYGEGSEAKACIYQISNSRSLGVSEDDIIAKINATAIKLEEDEITTRNMLLESNENTLKDRILRSVGTLKYSYLLSSSEFFDCYMYYRLGISLGITQETDLLSLDTLLCEAMPAHILSIEPRAAEDAELRDKIRAKIVKQKLQEE